MLNKIVIVYKCCWGQDFIQKIVSINMRAVESESTAIVEGVVHYGEVPHF